MDDRFVEVEVEPNEACPDGVSLRFKRAGDVREIARVAYESEDGIEGWWHVEAMKHDDPRAPRERARAVIVEDSSEGETLLIVGDRFGLRLEHEETGHVVREPYLVLARTTRVE
jgi:hypothetical protein